jgi:glyoxylase-like metal-dependent hydrolase (beta-lactamase superfamily II)
LSSLLRADTETYLEASFTQGIQEALPRLRFRYPNLTFEKSLTLHGSVRSVQLISFNGGHTQSDTVLWLPEERILATGDILYIGAHPYLSEADPRQTLFILDQIAALEPGFLLPGHGSVGTSRDLLVMQGYLSTLISKAEDLARRDQPLAAVKRMKVPSAYQSWQLGANYIANLRRMITQVARENDLELGTQTQEINNHLII